MNTRRISLRSLFWYFVRRLWVLVIFMILGGVAVAGLKYMKDKKEAEAEEGEVTPTVVADVDSLSESERYEVDNAYIQYRQAEAISRYMKDSPLMAVNPKEEEQVMVEYGIFIRPAGEKATDGSLENTYLQLLRAYIADGMYIPELIKISDVYQDSTYLKELIWCNNTSGGELSLGVVNTETYPNLAKDLRKVLENYAGELMRQETGLSIRALREGTYTVYDSTTENAKRSLGSNLISYRKGYTTAYAAFNQSQKLYFKQLVEQKSGTEWNWGDDQGETEEPEKTTTKKKVGISRRYAAVGLFVGLAVGLVFLFVLLYLSLRHATTADYAENAGLRSFGLFFLPGKGGFRNWTVRMEMKHRLFPTTEDSVKYAALRLGQYCDTHGIKDLAVLCSKNSGVVEEAAEELGKELKKNGVILHSTERVATDSEALRELLRVKKSIFLEQLYAGNRQKQQELLHFCRENEVEILGAVGVTRLALGAKKEEA